jgi:hypothetical protein
LAYSLKARMRGSLAAMKSHNPETRSPLGRQPPRLQSVGSDEYEWSGRHVFFSPIWPLTCRLFVMAPQCRDKDSAYCCEQLRWSWGSHRRPSRLTVTPTARAITWQTPRAQGSEELVTRKARAIYAAQ